MKGSALGLLVCCIIAAPAMSSLTSAPDNLPDLNTWPTAVYPLTTHQYWTFSWDHVVKLGIEFVAEPEEVDNPIPQSVFLTINAKELGGSASNGTFYGDNLSVRVPLGNYEDVLYKIMWFDIGASAAPVDISWSATGDGQDPLDFDYVFLPGQGDAEFGLKIIPNPAWEEIHFVIPGTAASLDYLHIDTISIPEPVTTLLFGGIGLVCWLRRRRTL